MYNTAIHKLLMESNANQLLRFAPLEDAMSASTSAFTWANFQPTLPLTKLQIALCSKDRATREPPSWGGSPETQSSLLLVMW